MLLTIKESASNFVHSTTNTITNTAKTIKGMSSAAATGGIHGMAGALSPATFVGEKIGYGLGYMIALPVATIRNTGIYCCNKFRSDEDQIEKRSIHGFSIKTAEASSFSCSIVACAMVMFLTPLREAVLLTGLASATFFAADNLLNEGKLLKSYKAYLSKSNQKEKSGDYNTETQPSLQHPTKVLKALCPGSSSNT